jgi:hypothetical protein
MPTASAEYKDDEKQAMARAAATLLARWGASDETVDVFLQGASDGQTERIAALLNIHAALRRIFSDGDRAARWIGSSNVAFDGESALDVMLAEGFAGMRRVKAYLDAEIAA